MKTKKKDTRAKFAAIINELQAQFVGREAEIRGLVLALLSGEHALLIGPPGTGKSALVRALTGAIDGAQGWEYLLTRFSEPNEILGPIDLKQWSDKGDYARRTAGYLPTAHVGFADEIFKANSSILNALLSILNERLYHEAGQAVRCPLRTMVGASNELPEGGAAGELAALYDRFVLRFDVQPPQGEDAFTRIVGAAGEPSITARVTLQELDEARAEVAAMPLPSDTVRAMFECSRRLEEDGVTASHRRWRKATKVLRAAAWLDGDAEVEPVHFTVLADILWDVPSEAGKVRGIVAKVVAPQLGSALEIKDAVLELVAGLPSTGSVASSGQAVLGELRKATKRLEKLSDESTSAVRSRVEAVLDEVDEARETLTARIKAELFGDDQPRRSRSAQ